MTDQFLPLPNLLLSCLHREHSPVNFLHTNLSGSEMCLPLTCKQKVSLLRFHGYCRKKQDFYSRSAWSFTRGKANGMRIKTESILCPPSSRAAKLRGQMHVCMHNSLRKRDTKLAFYNKQWISLLSFTEEDIMLCLKIPFFIYNLEK